MSYDLSICIPSRQEEFLTNTIDDILKNKRGNTQIIVGLDGCWPHTPIKDHPDVVIVHYSESIGQRSITNRCVEVSKAKYIVKLDAHCGIDEGFDIKMMNLMEDDITMVGVMRNLHVFDWVCPDGHRRYQGPSGVCTECGKPTTKDIRWIPKTNPQSTAFRFDTTLHFQYHNDFGKQQKGDLTETMSLQGSCFMITRDRYWDLNICDEAFGSWGQQGVEVACKSWLTGGRVLVNRTTWHAHMFRTSGADFGFPYPLSGRAVERARKFSRELFLENKWPLQKYPLSWLIEKFKPLPDWHEESGKKVLDKVLKSGKAFKNVPGITPPISMAIPTENNADDNIVVTPVEATKPTTSITQKKEISKGILYYTNNRLNMKLARLVRKYIADSGLPITSVTHKPTNFGKNIVFSGENSNKTMFQQILKGLEEMKEDVIYFSEHDVLYHPSHFKFTLSDPNIFYYNGNYWMLRLKDGFAIHYDVSPLSGLVAYREPLLIHFRERMELIEKEGFSLKMGFEPMTHKRIKWEHWYNFEIFNPEFPNVDIAHSANLTWKRWKIEQFRRKPKFWNESDIQHIPGWPNLPEMLSGIS